MTRADQPGIRDLLAEASGLKSVYWSVAVAGYCFCQLGEGDIGDRLGDPPLVWITEAGRS